MLRASQILSKRIVCVSSELQGVSGLACRSCSSKVTQQPEAATQQTKPASAPLPEPELPPPPKKSGGFFWKFLGLTLVSGGGVVGYAWYDKNFRKTVEDNVPYSKEALDYAFQYLPPTETPPVSPKSGSLSTSVEEAKKLSLLKKKEDDVKTVTEVAKPTAPKPDTKPTKAEIEAKRKEEERLKKEEEKRMKEEKKRREKEEAERKIKEREMEEAAENAALENILETSLEDTQNAILAAIDLEKSSAEATRAHTDQLRGAMDHKGEEADALWETATKAFALKADTLAKAEAATEDARIEMEKLRVALSTGKANRVTKKNKALSDTEQSLNSLSYDLKTAIAQNAKAQSEAKMMLEFRDLIKKGREQFKKEVESLTPEVTLGKKGSKLTEEELNSLIAHAHRRIEQLQHQLAEQQALEMLRIDQAIQRQREEDEKLADGRVNQERERQAADLVVHRDRWEAESRVAYEYELRKELARQAAAHSDHLADVLKVQERDLKGQFDVLLGERIATERDDFQREVAGWIARLKGIEAAVEGRAEMEKIGRKAQELWLACQMLYNVLQSPPQAAESTADDDDLPPYEKRMRPLLDEFIAVLDAGNNHPFVNSVLESIPDEAVKRGVWTEKELFDRFQRVKRVCRRTAMIDETGGTLFKYFLSYVQSFFVFSASKPIGEVDNVDPANLTTFVILDNAYNCLEHGDLEQALRFMNQLKGEPRRLAADWIKEARLLLETQQAANALLAHASGNGLGALF